MTFKIKNLRNNSTTTLTAYLLSRYFRLGVWDYGMVASHDGNTYNPSALYIQRNRREHYGKEYGLEKSFAPILRHKYSDTVSGLPLRPLIIVDENGHRMSEQEVFEFVRNYEDSDEPAESRAYEDERTFRKQPVPNTSCQWNSTNFAYRSGTYYDEDAGEYCFKMRSRRNDKSWKKDFKCRKAWAKHTGINARKVSKRMEYLPETEQDAILYKIEMESKQLRREYAKYYEMYNTSEKEKATHIA